LTVNTGIVPWKEEAEKHPIASAVLINTREMKRGDEAGSKTIFGIVGFHRNITDLQENG